MPGKIPITFEIDETRANYPGSSWSRAEQCDAHRPNTKTCVAKNKNECEHLCCAWGGNWYDFKAPLTGTSCGKKNDEWCVNGECVAKYFHKRISVNDVDNWLISKGGQRKTKTKNNFRKHITRKHKYKKNTRRKTNKKNKYLYNKRVVSFSPGMKNIKIVFENWKNAALAILNFDKIYLSPKLKRKQFSSTKTKKFKSTIGGSIWKYVVTKHIITITAEGPINVGVTAVLKMKNDKYEKRKLKYEFWYKAKKI
jgi:hypothetical protein